MSKRNSDFFREKKIWSEVKDSLLGCYLKPYFQKILLTWRPTLYIDGFAGKGVFDDGSKGSPLISLEIIEDCIKNSSRKNAKISSCFIELNHFDDLQRNLPENKDLTIISGKYEDNVEQQLTGKNDYNVFLYLDPYGIKALKFDIFKKLTNKKFYSFELLINMNSFGFIREACHVMGIEYDIDVSDDIIEYEPINLKRSEGSIQELDIVAGGDYWKRIILDYNQKRIDGYEAERRFAELYCKQLKQIFKYVLNMPIRLKKGQHPKYRMIHTTNHEDGCLIMNDNICKRWEAWQEAQDYGQLSMFKEDTENRSYDGDSIRKDLIVSIKSIPNYTYLNQFLAEFVTTFGVRCSTSDIKKQLKILEDANMIEVKRNPETTAKGSKSIFWDCKSGNTVMIRGIR